MECKYCKSNEIEVVLLEFSCRINDRNLTIDKIPHYKCLNCDTTQVDPLFLASLQQVVEKLIPYFDLLQE